MKYRYALVSFPFLGRDENNEVTHEKALMRFTSYGTQPEIDLRRVKREIRKWVKINLGRVLHCTELRAVLRRVQYTQ